MKATARIFILAFLLFASSTAGFAQEGGEGSFYFVGGLSFSPYNSDSDISEFQKGYNNSWKPELSQNWKRDLFAWNYSFGAQYWVTNKMGFQYNIRYATHSYDVAFTNGEKRDQVFHVRTPLEFGILVGNPEKFYMNFSFGYATSRFVCTHTYKDGTKSLNYESSLNGVFSASGFSYRLEAYYKLYKQLQLVGAFGGLIGSEYTDKNGIRGIDSRLGPYEIKGFPKDYTTFQSTVGAGAAYDYPIDKWANLKYFTISVGLVYRLKLFQLKSNR